MTKLIWAFSNDHKWCKEFNTMELAEDYAHTLGLYANNSVVLAWIDTGDGIVWLKEKAQA